MLALVGDLTGPSLWRVLSPFWRLEECGYACGWDMTSNQAARALIRNYDGLLLARTGWQRFARRIVENAMLEAHDAGRFVVMDLDDDLLTSGFTERQLELGWGAGKTYEQLEVERYERIWALGRVDGVTVSTDPLAAVVRSYTSVPVVVVPNAIDVPWFRAAVKRHPRELPEPVIGWAGGTRPDADLAAVAGAWARIAQRYRLVTFMICGYVSPLLAAAVPQDRLCLVPWMPLERYPEPLGEIDVACCSVAPDRFNACKSVIKGYESAVAGSAVVASPTLYGDLIEHGTTGYLAETVDEWTAALADLVEHPADRRMMARRLLRHVERRFSLRSNLHRWPAAWAAIRTETRRRHARIVSLA